MPVYCIPANVGTEMRLYIPLLCAKFQGNRMWRSRFIAVFVSVRQEKEEEKSRISCEHVKRFRSNLECGVLQLEGISTAKIVLFHQGSTELRRCENCVFFLPVNILTVLRAGFLGRMTHYRVS